MLVRPIQEDITVSKPVLVDQHIGPFFVVPSFLVALFFGSYAFAWCIFLSDLEKYAYGFDWLQFITLPLVITPYVALFVFLPVLFAYVPAYFVLHGLKKFNQTWIVCSGSLCGFVTGLFIFGWTGAIGIPESLEDLREIAVPLLMGVVGGGVGGYAAYRSMCWRIAYLQWRRKISATQHDPSL